MTGITSSPSASIMTGIVTSGATVGLAHPMEMEAGRATSGYSDAPAATPNLLVMHPAGRFQRFAHSVAAFAPVIGIGTALAAALYLRDWSGLGLLAIAVPGPRPVVNPGDEKTPTIEPAQLVAQANQFLKFLGQANCEVVLIDPELEDIAYAVDAFLESMGENSQVALRRYPEGVDRPDINSFYRKEPTKYLVGKFLQARGHSNLEVLIVDTEGLINAGIIAFFRAYNLDVAITRISEPLAKPTPQPLLARFPQSIGELPIHGKLESYLSRASESRTFPTTHEFCTSKRYSIAKNSRVLLNKALRPFGLRLGMTEAEFTAAEAAYARNPFIIPLPQYISELPVYDLALNALGNFGIESLRDLCLRSELDIIKVDRLGASAFDTITSALRAYGLRLGMTAAEFDAVAAARASQQK